MPSASAARRSSKVPTNVQCSHCDLIWMAYWTPPFPKPCHHCPRCKSHALVDLWAEVPFTERWERRGRGQIAQTYRHQRKHGTAERSKLPLAGEGGPRKYAKNTLPPDRWLTIAARFSSLCPWCDERIAIGDVVRWRPGEQAQHPECHVNAM